MSIVRDLYYARKISAGLKLPAPTVALLIKRMMLASTMNTGTEKTVSGALVHITDALAIPAKSVLASIAPIQPGSGDPSPDNVRPISGLTGMSVYRTGKNLLPNLRNIGANRIALGQTEGYTTETTNLAAGTYTLSITHTSSVNWRVYERHNSTNTVLGRLTPGGGTDSFTFTVDSDTNYSISVYDANGVDSDAIIQFWLEIGSKSTSYEAHNGSTYSEDWSAQAGTVYSGTVDVVSGELTVDMVNIPSYNGEAINEPWLSSMDAYAAGTTPTIGAQVVYTLAAPLTYQLTPQEVQMLLGENNVWSSSGDTVSVTYTA